MQTLPRQIQPFVLLLAARIALSARLQHPQRQVCGQRGTRLLAGLAADDSATARRANRYSDQAANGGLGQSFARQPVPNQRGAA